MHTHDVALKKLVIEKLDQLGSLDYTRRYLNELKAKIAIELMRLGLDPEFLKTAFKKATEKKAAEP